MVMQDANENEKQMECALSPASGSGFRDDSKHARHFICVECRKGFKGAWPLQCPQCKRDLKFHERDGRCPDCGCDIKFFRSKVCPDCGREMREVSKDMKIPKRADAKAWRTLASLIEREARHLK